MPDQVGNTKQNLISRDNDGSRKLDSKIVSMNGQDSPPSVDTNAGTTESATFLSGERLLFDTSLLVESSIRSYDTFVTDDNLRKGSITHWHSDSELYDTRLIQEREEKRNNAFDTFKKVSKPFKSIFCSLDPTLLERNSSAFPLDKGKCSNFQAFMVLLRGNTGPGILSLPAAFKFGGLWVGLFLFFVIAAVAIRSVHVLVYCCSDLEIRHGIRPKNYVEVSEYTFLYGHPRLQKYSSFFRHFTNGLMQMMQYGVCCVYFVFIATNIEKVVSSYWSSSPDVRVYEVAVYVLVLPYVMIKNLRTLSFFSAFANALYIIGLVTIFTYIFRGIPDIEHRRAVGSWTTLPLFFGTSLFAYEGINIAIPVRNSMKSPQDFGGWSGVVNVCLIGLTCVYASFGFFGYVKYGEYTEGSVTLNLPQGDRVSDVVNVAFSAMVFLSMAVQFYVPISVLWPAVEKKLERKWNPKSPDMPTLARSVANVCIRFLVITIIFVVALLIPHIELLISLVGALLGTTMAILLPCVLDLVRLQSQQKLTSLAIAKNSGILLFGIVGLATGTYTSLVDIIKAF